MPTDPQGSAATVERQWHGPIVWARGRDAYAHLGWVAAQDADAVREHLTQSHRIVPAEGAGSWPRNIECHARVHDVAMSAPWPVQDGASDDRDVLTPPRATCVCSHVKAHHPLSLGAYRAGCIWRGCGCPAFVREAGNA